jgi:hypothetical protein
MSYYVGNSPQDVVNGIIKRYFYGMRRNDDGELFLVRSDQLQGGEEQTVTINDLGTADGNFPDFEEGIDFLDGINEDHDKLYANLRYPQIKWDGRSVLYYVDPEDGQLILRISEGYEYPQNISAEGY